MKNFVKSVEGGCNTSLKYCITTVKMKTDQNNVIPTIIILTSFAIGVLSNFFTYDIIPKIHLAYCNGIRTQDSSDTIHQINTISVKMSANVVITKINSVKNEMKSQMQSAHARRAKSASATPPAASPVPFPILKFQIPLSDRE